MKWWETELAVEMPAYVTKLEDDIERLESRVAQLKAVPIGRKSEIICEFFSGCRCILTDEELVLVALKFAGYTCGDISRVASKLATSRSTVHRKIQAAQSKLQQQFSRIGEQ